LSNPKATFLAALEDLSAKGVEILAVSGLWQSPAWPPEQGHPDYLNAAAEVSFSGTARHLLAILQEVELTHGRKRSVKNAPRTLDLDILDFKGQHIDEEGLTLPHPRMLERGFVLFPLEQVAPEWADPITGQDIEAFIARLPISDIEPMRYIGNANFHK